MDGDSVLKGFTKEKTSRYTFPLHENNPLYFSLEYMLFKESRNGTAQGRGENSIELLHSWKLLPEVAIV